MSNTMTISELKALIAKQIKDKGLNNILPDEMMENIKDRIISKFNLHKASMEIPELIPEADSPAASGGPIQFPQPEQSPEIGTPDNSGRIGMESGGEPTGNLEEPKMGYTPELPSFIEKIEPGKVIIFSQNELSEGGENLANKELRTFSNPDLKKSIHDLWIEEGKKKAEVYLAKLEKIGDLDFDYANGTAKFTEKRLNPELPTIGTDKENVISPAPEQKLSSIPELMNISMEGTINSSDKMLKEAIEDVLRSYNIIKTPESIVETNGFSLKMLDLVKEENGFSKIDTPEGLLEKITKGDKSIVINENQEVREWGFNDKSYFLPTRPLSFKKCYIKKV